jgi:hypothetical protein
MPRKADRIASRRGTPRRSFNFVPRVERRGGAAGAPAIATGSLAKAPDCSKSAAYGEGRAAGVGVGVAAALRLAAKSLASTSS